MEDFLRKGISVEFDNGQTRLLAGIHQEVGFGECNYNHFLLARKNIDKYFSLVGVMEKFDESLLLMKNIFGWRFLPLYLKKNVNPNKVVSSKFSKQTLELIKEYNKFDIELYNYTLEVFQNKLSKIKFRKIIIPTYKCANKIYQLLNN